MRYSLWILLLLCLIGCDTKPTDSLSERARAKLYPNEHFFQQRAYPFGIIDQKTIMNSYKQVRSGKHSSSRFTDNWEFKGPTNIGGRVTDLDGIIKNGNVKLFVCTASGGIFTTTNDGQSWESIFDDNETLVIGDMAISQSNNDIMYVGTGEANAGGGSIAYDGNGVYKSIDGGNSWEHLGLENIGSVGKVIVHPTDPNVVYVAAMGALFRNNNERGIFRTIDGGQTWDHVLSISDHTGGIDIVMDMTDPSTVYAAMWDRIRTPSQRLYGGINSGIYKSTDGGNNWNRLENGLPINDGVGRIGLTISPSESNILYATISADNGSQIGIYKTSNSGAIWNKTSGVVLQVPFMWWFGKIHVHPNDASQVYHSGFNTEYSSDSGESFGSSFSGAHVDQHALWFNPENPDVVYIGNDGGVYKSINGGNNHFKLPNLTNTQFYTVEIDNLRPNRLYGGTQDNNTIRTAFGNINGYNSLLGGDGFRVLVDPTDSDIFYCEYQYGNLFKSENGGLNVFRVTDGIPSSDRNNWNSPLAMDVNNPETLYFGTQHIYKTTDGANSWTRVSNDLSNGVLPGVNTNATLTSIDVSEIDGRKIIAGTDDGNVWISENEGGAWTKVSANLPNRWVTSVSFDPDEEHTIYVTYSGFRYGEDISNAYMSTNLGGSWESITENLVETPINDLISIPKSSQIVIATDIGVFLSEDEGQNWELLGDNLPNLIISDIDYHLETNKLVAATYGRGLYSYQIQLPTGNTEIEVEKAELYPNPATNLITVIWNGGTSGKYALLSMDGRTMKQGNVINGESIDISTLNKGSYILTIDDHNKTLQSTFIKI